MDAAVFGTADLGRWRHDGEDEGNQGANERREQCGCREGHDLEDWFDAEAIVMEARREASHMSRIEQI